ncbi:MAG: CbiX/SirB N-terminal domain-containing protein [Halococcoides sp.]
MPALVVAAHGSHLNPDSSRPARDHAATIRATGAFEEVRTAFWKEEPSFRDALRTVASDEIFLVPLFVSRGYFTEQVLPREFRLSAFDRDRWAEEGSITTTAADVDATIHYCGPVGTDPVMSDVIVQRAESITGETAIGAATTLAIVGHGTERNQNSADAIYDHVERIREQDRFAAVEALFMDEAPEIDDWPAVVDTERVVIVPLFVADGYHTREDLPEDIGLVDDYRESWATPARVAGHEVYYSGAVGTEPLTAEVILDRAERAGANVEHAMAAIEADAITAD